MGDGFLFWMDKGGEVFLFGFYDWLGSRCNVRTLRVAIWNVGFKIGESLGSITAKNWLYSYFSKKYITCWIRFVFRS